MVRILEAYNDDEQLVDDLRKEYKQIFRNYKQYIKDEYLVGEDLYNTDTENQQEFEQRNEELENIIANASKYYAVIDGEQYVEFISSKYGLSEQFGRLNIKDGINVYEAPYGFIVRAYYNQRTDDLIFVKLLQEDYEKLLYLDV